MLTIENKSIFSYENVDAIVNPCNTVGIMGAGLALKFKNLYPTMFEEYRNICKSKNLQIGKLHIYINRFSMPKYIVNFPTKNHWKDDSKLEYIETGLQKLVEFINNYNIKTIVIPALGCGLGNLDFEDVTNLILKYLKDLNIGIVLLKPN